MIWCRQPGSRAIQAAAMAWRTACWYARPLASRPERQVRHTLSRSRFGTWYQSRRHIRRVGSIWSPQPGTAQRPAGSGKPVCCHWVLGHGLLVRLLVRGVLLAGWS